MSSPGSEPGAQPSAPGWLRRWFHLLPAPTPDDVSSNHPSSRWTWWFLAALLVVVAARFVRLDIDPPYGILSDTGEYLTDEGWYTQSAQLRVNFGDWNSKYDFVWFSGTVLFVYIESIAFRIGGVSMQVARMTAVFFSCVALAAFYGLLRLVQPRAVALATCLIAAITLHAVGYSRLALVEPTANAVSMLALLAWARLPRGVPACTAALLLGAAAYFVKASFIFTLVAVALLALGEAVWLARERKWGQAATIVVSMAALAWIIFAVQRGIDSVAPDQAKLFQRWHRDWRIAAVVGGDNVFLRECKYVARAFVKLPFVTNTQALGAVIVTGGALILRRTKGSIPVPRSRTAIALGLWLVGGTAFFGLFDSQPARYFGLAIFPLAFLAVSVLRELVPANRWALAMLCLFGVHLAVQIPGYAAWLGRDDLTTADAAARDAVSRMDLEGAEGGVGVIGDTSSTLSLYDPRFRPLTYRHSILVFDRVDTWRPRYLFDFPSRAVDFVRACPGIVDRVEKIASYRIMDNYCTEEDYALYRIDYMP